MLGDALGNIGLSLDDFCALTPEEYAAVHKAWRERQEEAYRDEWERMRLLAAITVQPHCKKSVNPKKLIPFPWERPKKKKVEQVSREEAKKRLERRLAKCTCQDC